MDSSPDPHSQFMFGSTSSQPDDRGIYRIYGLGPGMYLVSVGQASAAGGAASIMGMGGSQYVKTFYPSVEDESRATIIEIKEGTEIANVDITVNKPGKGFAISGRVIYADSGAPAASVYVGHSVIDESNQQVGSMNFSGTQTDANGKFRLEGLRPGRYAVYTMAARDDNSTYSEQVTFEVAAGAQINGLRLVFVYGTGWIRGEVKIEGGSLPEGVTLRVILRSAANESRRFNRGAELDSRLHFILENIPPGSYEVVVTGMKLTPGAKPTPPVEYLKQPVTVANGTETKVSLVVDFTAKEGSQP